MTRVADSRPNWQTNVTAHRALYCGMERFHVSSYFSGGTHDPGKSSKSRTRGPKALKAALTSALHSGLITVINLGNIGDVARFNVASEPTLQKWLRNFVTPGGFIPYRGTTELPKKPQRSWKLLLPVTRR